MKPDYERGGVRLWNCDCLEWLATLEAGSVDAVVTDPPYGIDGSAGTINTARGKGDYTGMFSDTRDYIAVVVVPAVVRLIDLCGCVILTPGNRNFDLYPRPTSFGCYYQPAATGLQAFGNLDAQPIFYYGKNASRKNMGVPCSYQLTEQPEKNGHPCAKPLRTWAKLVSNNTLAGHVVADPFAGSGTTGVACVKLGRRFLGCEIDPRYFDIACKRIDEAIDAGALFDPTPPSIRQGGLFEAQASKEAAQ